MHPYLVRQMSDFGFRKPLRGSNFGVRAEISTYPACLLANLTAYRVELEGKGRHDSLPRFGPPCGVKPYSCFVVDLPRGAEEELVQWRTTSGGVFLSSSELVSW